MTHETKAGVLVSGAFICLVGGVVYLKMNEGAAPGEAPGASELPPWPTAAEKQGAAPTAKDNAAVPGMVAPMTTTPHLHTPPPAPILLTGGNGPTIPQPARPGGNPLRAVPEVVPVTPEIPPAGREPIHVAVDPLHAEHAVPAAPPFRPGAAVDPAPPPPEAPGGRTTGRSVGADPAPVPPVAGREEPAPTLSGGPTVAPPAPAADPPINPVPVSPVPVTPTPEALSPLPTPPLPTPPVPVAPVPENPPVVPGVQIGPPQSNNSGGNQRGGVMPDPRLTPLSAADTAPPERPPVAYGSPAPLAATPTATTPPVPVLGVPGSVPAPAGAGIRPAVVVGPGVESFDEETYTCRANETFKSISQLKYHTETYDRALLTYNRAHPLAAEGIRNEPPLLPAGQPVYVPPVEILQRRYSATAPPVQPPTPAGAGPNTSWSSPAREPLYQVQGKSETFYEIAQKVLRDGDKWPDIWRLNPEYKNPAVPLPINAVVRLPAAR